MTTLIQTGHPGSPLYRRCDARCHYARFATCDCVCGGRYHGRGIDGSLVEKVHETGDQFLEYLERQGCDVAELRAAKKGELAERLETERKAWLARKPGARRRAGGARKRSRHTRDARQGAFTFGARDAILGRPGEGADNRPYAEISGRQDASPANADDGPVERQDGAEKECLDNG